MGKGAQVPVLRHFSVMSGGIKTYPGAPRKMLFVTPGSLNTDHGFAARRRCVSAPYHKI
jgi:hypothetical protein